MSSAAATTFQSRDDDQRDQPSAPATSPQRRWLADLALFAATTFILLAGAEIYVRLVYLKQPHTGRSDRPGTYYFPEQSASARDYYYSLEKPPGTYRIAVVGDSFTFGFDNYFDDSFPKRLERMLNLNKDQPKVEVINFGTPGLSTFQEVPSVRSAIEEYHADLVLLEVTLNDTELKPPHLPPGELGRRLRGELPEGGIYSYWKTLAVISAQLRASASRSEYSDYFHRLFAGEKNLTVFKSSLDMISELGRRSGVPIHAVVFPLFALPLDDDYSFDDLHKRTGELLTAAGLPVFDLRDSYRGIPHERLEAIPGADPHPNEIAHRIAAESIYGYLAHADAIPGEIRPRLHSAHRELRSTLK